MSGFDWLIAGSARKTKGVCVCTHQGAGLGLEVLDDGRDHPPGGERLVLLLEDRLRGDALL